MEGPRNPEETLMAARMREAREKPSKKKAPSTGSHAERPVAVVFDRTPRRAIKLNGQHHVLSDEKVYVDPEVRAGKAAKRKWTRKERVSNQELAKMQLKDERNDLNEVRLMRSITKTMKAERAAHEKGERKQSEKRLSLERAFDETPEEKAEKAALKQELQALKEEYDAQERNPNSLKEYKDKLKALLEKYSPEGRISPATTILGSEPEPEGEPEVAAAAPSAVPESAPAPNVSYGLKATYDLQPSSSPYAHSWSYEIPKDAMRASPNVQKPSPVEYDPQLHSPEVAARIYQTGEGFVSPPAVETAPETLVLDARAMPPPATAKQERIVMVNPILSRQAGMKKNLPPSPFAAAGATAPLEASRTPKKAKRGWFRGALAAIGLLAAGTAVEEGVRQQHHGPPPAVRSLDGGTGVQVDVSKQMQQLEYVKQHPPVVVPMNPDISVSIDTKGEGADKLYQALMTKVRAQYPDAAKAPPLIQSLLAFKNADEFSSQMRFEQFKKNELPRTSWMYMNQRPHQADTFKISDNGKTLVYIDSKNVPHILMTTTPQGQVFSYPAEGLAMHPYRPRA